MDKIDTLALFCEHCVLYRKFDATVCVALNNSHAMNIENYHTNASSMIRKNKIN